jgi:hypothetical protein
LLVWRSHSSSKLFLLLCIFSRCDDMCQLLRHVIRANQRVHRTSSLSRPHLRTLLTAAVSPGAPYPPPWPGQPPVQHGMAIDRIALSDCWFSSEAQVSHPPCDLIGGTFLSGRVFLCAHLLNLVLRTDMNGMRTTVLFVTAGQSKPYRGRKHTRHSCS